VPPRMMAYTQSPAEAEPQPVSTLERVRCRRGRWRHCRFVVSASCIRSVLDLLALPEALHGHAATPCRAASSAPLSLHLFTDLICRAFRHIPMQGGKFSLYGGSVQGVFREVVPNQRIVMDWRFRCVSLLLVCSTVGIQRMRWLPASAC